MYTSEALRQQSGLENYIKVVAIYLRKSRGESDEDLEKHRLLLVDMCKKYNWQYMEYVEIANSEWIEMRPVFSQLLKDIEEELFDAVLVVDWDRLGRGDMGEVDRIKKTLQKAQTFVITPTKWYDLSNDDDDFTIDAKAFLARQEYKMIVKRLNRGKKVGARLGHWTNGTPPFPYEYDPDRKGLVVNERDYKVYRFIIEAALEGYAGYEIAWELNKQGILSPRGKKWSNTTIYRLLRDETHLGKIITNKTQGSGHKKKKPNAKEYKVLPKSKWVVVENCHEPVKTQEEHDKIIMLLSKRKRIPTAARAGKHALSGLIRCAVCGSTLQIYKATRGRNPQVRTCQHADPYGNRCENRGGSLKLVMDEINLALKKYEEKLIEDINNDEGNEVAYLQGQIQEKLKQIEDNENAIERIEEGFEAGLYTAERALQRKKKYEDELDQLHEELSALENQLKKQTSVTNEERLYRIKSFWEKLNATKSNNELNKLYKNIIDSVVWERIGDNPPKVTVNFL